MADWVLGVDHQDITNNSGFTFVGEQDNKIGVLYAARVFKTKKEAQQYLPSVAHLEPGLKPLRKDSCLDEHTRQAVQITCDALVRTDNEALAGKVLEFLEMSQILSAKNTKSIQKGIGLEDD